MARRRICAVPGCASETGAYWKVLCRSCFRALPNDIVEELRTVRRLTDVPKPERDRRFRKAQREARDFMAARKAEQDREAADTFNRTQDLLGERS